MAITGAVVAIAATGYGAVQSEKARQEQKAASRTQEKIASRQTQRERISQFRQAQIARAQVAVAGEAAGLSGQDSIQSGKEGSLTSTAAGNISFINSIESLRQEIQRRQEKAAQYAGNASNAAAVASIAGGFVTPSSGASTQPDYASVKSKYNIGG